jgi:hypothetical protein
MNEESEMAEMHFLDGPMEMTRRIVHISELRQGNHYEVLVPLAATMRAMPEEGTKNIHSIKAVRCVYLAYSLPPNLYNRRRRFAMLIASQVQP